ncbi:chaplin [Streptomyces sp. NPDC007088]|uniref:chaplin n=1 Tax=Streptomyces sp. NPDC007088 TaxID=3364773 RepID=UPI0036B0D1F6
MFGKAKSAAVLVAVGMAVVGGAGAASADAGAEGFAAFSPGVLSGNVVQVPVSVPVNACGNSVNVVGLLNPALGNGCANGSGRGHDKGGWDHKGGRDHGRDHGGYGDDDHRQGGRW